MTAWTTLVGGHQRNIPAKLYWNRSDGLWQEDFLVKVYEEAVIETEARTAILQLKSEA